VTVRAGEDREWSQEAPHATVIFRSLGWMGAGHFAGQILWFGSLIVLGALLPPSAFGVVAVGMVVLFIANVLIGMGTRASIIAAPDLGASDVRAATLRTAGTGIVVAGIVAVLASPIAHALASGGQTAALRAMALAAPFMGLMIVPLALLDKHLGFKRSAGAKGGAAFGASLAAIVAALAGAGVWALVVRQVLYYGLAALLAWVLVRGALPRGGTGSGRRTLRRAGSRAFLVLGLADFTALTVDTLVVGGMTDATDLGLYTLAFTLAFAPLTQFSWPIGQVLFPVAAATEDLAVLARRTLVAVRTTALVLLPVVPAAIVSAPAIFPAVLGERWSEMVPPFQILLGAGVGHAILNCVGESLSGAGGIGFRARVHAVWAPATVAAVALLVALDGIRGAAIAHLALFVPLGAVYATRGVCLIGLRAVDIWDCLRGIALPVAAQALLTFGTFTTLTWAGTGASAGIVAAAVGLALAAVLLGRGSTSPVNQTRIMIADARSSSLQG